MHSFEWHNFFLFCSLFKRIKSFLMGLSVICSIKISARKIHNVLCRDIHLLLLLLLIWTFLQHSMHWVRIQFFADMCFFFQRAYLLTEVPPVFTSDALLYALHADCFFCCIFPHLMNTALYKHLFQRENTSKWAETLMFADLFELNVIAVCH